MSAESQFSAALDDWAAAMAEALSEIAGLRAEVVRLEGLWMSTCGLSQEDVLAVVAEAREEARRETIEACAAIAWEYARSEWGFDGVSTAALIARLIERLAPEPAATGSARTAGGGEHGA